VLIGNYVALLFPLLTLLNVSRSRGAVFRAGSVMAFVTQYVITENFRLMLVIAAVRITMILATRNHGLALSLAHLKPSIAMTQKR
jgi:hypothetical protein